MTLKKVALGTAGAVVAVGAATAALPILGFTTAGVAAGSAAAAAQSYIGCVAAGSAFASLQSAGVLGFATVTKGLLAVGGFASGYRILGSK